MKLLKSAFFVFIGLLLSFAVWAKGAVPLGEIAFAKLPREAQYTLALIKENKPLPYARDGMVFKNYEGVLPKQKRGYYREYTVRTPGVRHRGARRIVAGGTPRQVQEYFYTDDHYVSFKRIRE